MLIRFLIKFYFFNNLNKYYYIIILLHYIYMITSIVISNPKDWADENILLPNELIHNAILRIETVLS